MLGSLQQVFDIRINQCRNTPEDSVQLKRSWCMYDHAG